ncbi:MAG: peroxiredoxin [Pararhodobacter sp.]|nr:peroxiredoxin [Pararhodobacter sp.]
MQLTEGLRLPEASFPVMTDTGPAVVRLSERLKGRRVVIFAVPGAFTPTCDSAHVPSFIRTAPALRARGVDEIMCLSVNDAHVMRYWGRTTGATEAGFTMLADADAGFTRALGMLYSAPAAGMLDRSRRYAVLVEDGVVRVLHVEVKPGICELSGGEAMLEALEKLPV